MELILAAAIGVLTASGVWLILRPRTFQVVIGLSLLSYAVNLFLFSAGGLALDREPILRAGIATTLDNYADPLPHSLVLTAIVIGFALQAFLLALAWRSWTLNGNDDVEDDIEDRRIAAERRRDIRRDEAARKAERERALRASGVEVPGP